MSLEIKTDKERLPWNELVKTFPEICSKETSYNPEKWTPENPTKDHCAIASLLFNKIWGGKILNASLAGTPYAESHSHYINQTLSRRIDLTAPQFTQGYPEGLVFEEKTKEYLMGNENTLKRFTLLVLNYNKFLKGENPLFGDAIYQKCISKALTSSCKKMGFGAVLMKDGEVIAEANNHEIPELAYMCEGACIRNAIKSRTESMIGACGHAEEWVMKEARDKGVNLKECDLYVAGVHADAKLYIKNESEHTCLRCAVQMNYAELKSIRVPVLTEWKSLSPGEALVTAAKYAVGEKRV